MSGNPVIGVGEKTPTNSRESEEESHRRYPKSKPLKRENAHHEGERVPLWVSSLSIYIYIGGKGAEI